MATVTVRDFAILDANTPPPTSLWLSTQPPKISPFWLVSAGIASVRIQRSPHGSVSVTGGAWTACGSVMSETAHLNLIRGHLKLSQPASGVKRPPNFAANWRKVDATLSAPRVRA